MDHVPFSANPTGGRCLAARLSRAKKGAIVLTRWIAALLIVGAATSFVTAQDTAGASLEVQVAVQPLADGIVEFALVYEGERHLPRGRFLSQELIDQRAGTWLRSTPVNLLGPTETAPALLGAVEPVSFRDVDQAWDTPGFGRSEETVYVAVLPHEDGRIEFAVDHNGNRLLPDLRTLTPALRETRVGDWLVSSAITVQAAVTPASHVRGASYGWQDKTSGDVAEACVLVAAGLTTKPGGFSGGKNPPGSHAEFRYLLASRDTTRLSAEAVWLFAESTQFSWQTGLQDRYVFILRDLRYRLPTRVWFAEFNCAEPEPEPQTGQDLDSAPAGDNSLE